MEGNRTISSMLYENDADYLEYEITVSMSQDIETTRKRLLKSLAKLDYFVVEQFPILAKRAARNGAISSTSNYILDYPTKLTIELNPVTANHTNTIFRYEIKYCLPSKEDEYLVSLEVKALCSLINQLEGAIRCFSCQIEVTADSRFCRRCGKLLETPEPAELEVLRITSKAKNIYDYLVFGNICVAVALVALLFVGFAASVLPLKMLKLLKFFAIMGSAGFSLNLIWTHKLKSIISGQKEETSPKHKTVLELRPGNPTLAYQFEPTYDKKSGLTTGELVYKQPPPSVTENTTDLLPVEKRSLQNKETA